MFKGIGIVALVIFLAGLGSVSSAAETAKTAGNDTAANTPSINAKISLAEVAPELYYQLRRYPKFYGDPNTKLGGLAERTQLLGNAGGARDYLVDHGIYFDVAVTQFLQGNLSGGKDDGSARYNGSADYWLTVDTGKAGWWSGGAVFLHAESSWQANKSVNPDVGSLLPANFDATMPTPNESRAIALPELYLAQGLPDNFMLLLGKVNFAGAGDTNLFANNERTQFSYTGLVNNPILGAFIPYTPLGTALVWAPNKQNNLTLLATQATGDANSSGFNNFDGDYILGGQYQYSPMLKGNLPGHYLVLVGYGKKDLLAFDIDPRHLIGEIIGVLPPAEKSSNYAFLVNFDQYLWVKDGAPALGREHLPPVGVGIFGRAGWAPKDRNVIDQFYSLGIGGYGMLIPGRDNDQWGLGWAGTHISGDLRSLLNSFEPLTGVQIDDYENAFEAFYNIEFTPAVHMTINAQAIDSVNEEIDTAYTLGARLQLDF